MATARSVGSGDTVPRDIRIAVFVGSDGQNAEAFGAKDQATSEDKGLSVCDVPHVGISFPGSLLVKLQACIY